MSDVTQKRAQNTLATLYSSCIFDTIIAIKTYLTKQKQFFSGIFLFEIEFVGRF